jgi:Zn-dependent M28 family amino/carboxypeptidase
MLILLLPLPAVPQQPTLPAPVRAAGNLITGEKILRDATYLASDALRGRDTPSPGLDSAAAFVIRRLTALGLQPAGDNGTFKQQYSIRGALLDTAASSVDIDGRRLRYGSDFLVFSFSGPEDVSAPVVYVGHGLRVPKKNIDPYAGLDVKGKILVAHGPGSFPRGENFETLGALGVDWFLPTHVAKERGALAVVFIAAPTFIQFWDELRKEERARKSTELDPVVPSAYMAQPVTSIIVRPEAVQSFLQEGALSATELQTRASNSDFAPSFELPTGRSVSLHVAASVNLQSRPYNVVAKIEGSDPTLKAEAITLGAHLDGAVDDEPVNGDAIYNAADDNASGSAALLAIAEAMMKAPRPKRTVVFLWDTGEEVGIWGTRYFVAHPPVPIRNIVLHINVDMVGRTKRPGTNVRGEEELSGPNEVYVVGPRVISTQLDSLLEQTNRAYLNMRLNHRFDRADHEYFYPRTDAGPFLERGVATLDFFTGEHADYHRPSDEAAKLDPQKMEQVARTAFALTWLVADAPRRLVLDKGIPASVPRYR